MSSEGKPIQRMVRSLLVLVAVCVLGLIAGIVLVSVQNAETNRRLAVLEDYVQGRGEYRDREAARMEAEWVERNRLLACEMADQFPEGGWLDRLREKYRCGPGIPIERLSPEEQQKIAGSRGATAPEPEPAPAVTTAPVVPGRIKDGVTSGPASSPSDTVRTDPAASTEPPTPTPTPTAGPVPAVPLPDIVCDALGVCLKEVP